MPYPAHHRLVFGGPIFGDQWSCSLRLAYRRDQTGAGALDEQSGFDDIWSDLRNWYASPGAGAHGASYLTWMKLNAIGPDGKYANQTMTRERVVAQSAGVKGANFSDIAPQCAIAVTLRSARARGPLSRGRFFLPCGDRVGADGLITVARADALANSVVSLIRNLNNFPGIDTSTTAVALVSPGGRGLPEGGLEPVTAVEVGRVVDTQRRRRSDLLETPVRVAV